MVKNGTKIMEKESEIMRVNCKFKKRILKFIEDFQKKNGVKISETQATKILDAKIEKQGGLIV